jgi:hypothetical protein
MRDTATMRLFGVVVWFYRFFFGVLVLFYIHNQDFLRPRIDLIEVGGVQIMGLCI